MKLIVKISVFIGIFLCCNAYGQHNVIHSNAASLQNLPSVHPSTPNQNHFNNQSNSSLQNASSLKNINTYPPKTVSPSNGVDKTLSNKKQIKNELTPE